MNISPDPTGGPRWNIEMVEAGLIDCGIDYVIHDLAGDTNSADSRDAGGGFIEFDIPTGCYEDAFGQNRVRIRLTVARGRLTITAPDVYRPGSVKRTSDPPPDAAGNLRIVRLGDDGETNLDLVMAADGTLTAVLQVETIQRPFNRSDLVQISREFALGIDLLDFVLDEMGLRLGNVGESP